MISVLANTIIEDTLKANKYSYANIDVVRQAFKEVGDFSLDAIYAKYIDSKKNIDRLTELQANCKSDYTYWSYVAEKETAQLIKIICAKLLLSKINLDDLAEIKNNGA